MKAAVEGPEAFAAKRERIDEYGWRHFGDLYADHEAVVSPGSEPFDLALQQSVRRGGRLRACTSFAPAIARWWRCWTSSRAHVIDIDIYHTTEDKAGLQPRALLAHGALHRAGTRDASHVSRAAGGFGGGPSAEHNYTTGLMLHYFLTGDPRARDRPSIWRSGSSTWTTARRRTSGGCRGRHRVRQRDRLDRVSRSRPRAGQCASCHC